MKKITLIARGYDHAICIALEEVCDECGGTVLEVEGGACKRCGVSGLIPTEAGKAILELVRRYAK